MRRPYVKHWLVMGVFKRTDMLYGTWVMRCLGTAVNQQHLRHKVVVHLFRRCKACSLYQKRHPENRENSSPKVGGDTMLGLRCRAVHPSSVRGVLL